MLKLWPIAQFFLSLLFFLSGCSGNHDLIVQSPTTPSPPAEAKHGRVESEQAKGDLIVLLPEADGKTGIIRVKNAGGTQILDKAGETVRVKDLNSMPVVTHPTEEKSFASMFGDAISAQPNLNARFVSFTLWFESDKTKLTEGSKETLPEILKTIRIREPKEIHIVGHTDRVGTESHNLKLSLRRAKFVQDLFAAKGIKSKILFISCLGESRPLVYTEDEVAESLNRRVEIMIR